MAREHNDSLSRLVLPLILQTLETNGMGKIRTLIVDDEPLARQRVADLLAEHNNFELIGTAGDGIHAIEQIEGLKPDLLFLDIQMPELDGFEVLQEVENELPLTIFITAFDQYALQAFEVHALDYLLKPFDKERFERALERARIAIGRQQEDQFRHTVNALLTEIQQKKKFRTRFVIKESGKIVFLNSDEIAWIEAAGNYVTIHAGEKTYLLRKTMARIALDLDPEKFLRIHRSAIVNIACIKELESVFNGEYLVILQDRTRLTMSRTYRDKLPGLFKTTR